MLDQVLDFLSQTMLIGFGMLVEPIQQVLKLVVGANLSVHVADVVPVQLQTRLGVLRRTICRGEQRVPNALELAPQAAEGAGQARDRVVVAAALSLEAAELLLDVRPALALIVAHAAAHLGELEQVLLGAGRERPFRLVESWWPISRLEEVDRAYAQTVCATW